MYIEVDQWRARIIFYDLKSANVVNDGQIEVDLELLIEGPISSAQDYRLAETGTSSASLVFASKEKSLLNTIFAGSMRFAKHKNK